MKNHNQFKYSGKEQKFTGLKSIVGNFSEWLQIQIPGRVLNFEFEGKTPHSWKFQGVENPFSVEILND